MWACILCVDFFCMSLRRDAVHFLPPFPAKWPRCDLQLIMRPFSVGRCCCLLILSFTYNRQVLFTNRKQSSRCFIMSLLCVLTNAAGRLPWLAPLCRLLPGLERAARPATGGTRLQRNKSDFLISSSVVFFLLYRVRMGLVPWRINNFTRKYARQTFVLMWFLCRVAFIGLLHRVTALSENIFH